MPRNLAAAFSADDNITVLPSWASPDLTVVDAGRRKPPLLQPTMFGAVWPEFEKLASDKGCPVDYVALGYLSVAASIVGGKRRVRPYATGTWDEPLILWLGLVGDPSANKSPALDPLLNILRRIEKERADDHRDHIGNWMTDCERSKVERSNWQDAVKAAAKEGITSPPIPDEARDPPEPRRRRLFVQDATPESMADVLTGNPQGTLLLRDELDGWLSSFDRYNPGGRSFWLEAFGGRSFTIDRKSNPEPITVGFNGVSIIGGIQPQKLADSLLSGRSADDGMSARFLWVWPERPAFARPASTANLDALETALRRLDGLDWGNDENGDRIAIRLALDPAAADAFESLQRANRDHGDEAAGMLKSFVGKLDGIALRLALAIELANWAWLGGDEPRSVSAAAVVAVADFIEGYALPMAQRVYGDAGLPAVERNAASVARYLRRSKLTSFNARDLRRTAGLPGLRDAEPFKEALDALVEAEWLRPAPTRHGATVGRRTSDYLVNPAIYGAANG